MIGQERAQTGPVSLSMTKTPLLILFSLIFTLIVVYRNFKMKVIWRNKSKEDMISYHDSNKSIQKTVVSLKGANCRKLLLKYKSISLNEKLLQSLTENCFDQQRTQTKSIFKKQFIGVFGNISCQEKTPKFLNESGPLTALASFPGSGNTWSRVILEIVTGTFTVSVRGTMLPFRGFKICPSKTGIFVVKTHEMSIHAGRGRCRTSIKFSRAIYILRNPYDALMAEYNRRKGGKVKVADKIAFFKPSWIAFVNSKSERWKRMTLYWLTKVDIPVHVLVYENLKANTLLETYKMVNFLNLNVTLQNIYCLGSMLLNKYYRAKKPNWLTKTKLFNSKMKNLMNSNIKSVYLNIVNTSRNVEILKSYVLSGTK